MGFFRLSLREKERHAMKKEDLTGQTFNNFTVLYQLPERKQRQIAWMCRCRCGNEKVLTTTDLLTNRVKSCGCLKSQVQDISGQRRGNLVAVRCTGQRDEKGRLLYEWRCDCGNIVYRTSISVKHKNKYNMCPDCMKEFRAEQAKSAREKRVVVRDTGLTQTAFANIIEGNLTVANTSGVRGVSWHKGKQKWAVTGRVNGRPIEVGVFDSFDEAKEVREAFVRKTYGVKAEDTLERDYVHTGLIVIKH